MKHTADIKPDALGHHPAAKAKANHCEALLGKAPRVADTGALVDEFGKALAAALKDPLAELMGGAEPKIVCAPSQRIDASTCVEEQEPLATHFLIEDQTGTRALVATVGATGALTLCDRAFGGTGEIADPLPENLPMSADLTLGRLGKCLSSAMSSVMMENEIVLRTRGQKLARLVPFGRIAECVSIDISVEENEQAPWTIRLLAEAGPFSDWLNECDKRTDAAAGGNNTTALARTLHDTLAIQEIPLPLTAVLGECTLPLARISRLQAGDMIPLSMSREVPLMIGVGEVARGTVGTVDDRVALQITRTSKNTNLANGKISYE